MKMQMTTPMKQIFLYTSLAVMALAVTPIGAVPEPCEGTVQLTSQSNLQMRQAGGKRSSSSTSPACTRSAWQTTRS